MSYPDDVIAWENESALNDEALERDMRVVLRKLERLSHGATAAWNKSGGESGEPDDRMVAQVARRQYDLPPHEQYRIEFDRADGEFGRRRALARASAELAAWVKRDAPHIGESISFDEMVLEQGEGWDPEAVGQRFNVAPAMIRRIRQRAGREVETGQEPMRQDGDLAERAREMRARKRSTRQIALSLGVSQTQVMRWIAKRDAA